MSRGTPPDKKYVKSARVVSDVIGKYHPHGDQSIYDAAMVRMAQDFSMRVPLVDSRQFRFSRWRSARGLSIHRSPPGRSLEVLGDIDKDTVDFQPNYDNSEPGAIPVLGEGSATCWSMAPAASPGRRRWRNIPPHNLGEVIDACVALIDNPAFDRRPDHRSGPDFDRYPRAPGVAQAILRKRGSIVMRGKVTIDTIRKDREAIIVSEIPIR